jgi:hypothetical protein
LAGKKRDKMKPSNSFPRKRITLGNQAQYRTHDKRTICEMITMPTRKRQTVEQRKPKNIAKVSTSD